MSPTSRSSRVASASTVSSDSCSSSGSSTTPSRSADDVAPDRGQRRAQLVRDRHQEVALHHLDLGEPPRHLAEALAQVAELARRILGHRDGVVPLGDLVGGGRELQHRPHDAPREVPGKEPGGEQAEQAGDREPLDQVADALADVGLRRRDDDRAHRLLAEVDRFRDGEVRAMRVGRRELERQRLPGLPVDRLDRQALQPGDVVLAREDPRADEVDLVAGRELEVLGRELGRAAVVRRCRSSPRSRSCRGRRRPSPRDSASVSAWSCAKLLKSWMAITVVTTPASAMPARKTSGRRTRKRDSSRYVFVVSLRASFAGETL